MDNINMKDNKYITVLDFSNSRIYQYKLEELHLNEDGVVDHEEFLTIKGHKVNNIEWMLHDIKEFVDHTIRSVIKKDK